MLLPTVNSPRKGVSGHVGQSQVYQGLVRTIVQTRSGSCDGGSERLEALSIRRLERTFPFFVTVGNHDAQQEIMRDGRLDTTAAGSQVHAVFASS
jgi:hypothetical protein